MSSLSRFEQTLRHRASMWSLALSFGLMTLACAPTEVQEGVLGEQGLVFFQTFADAVFEQRLMVGSVVEVDAEARSAENQPALDGGRLRSSDETVLVVEAGASEGTEAFRLVGPGEAFLIFENAEGAELDRIVVRGAKAKRVELLDGSLVGSSVDSRAPSRFALVQNLRVPFFVSATDVCGEPLLPVEAATVVGDQNLLVEYEGVTAFVTPLVAGELELNVETSGEEPLIHEVISIDPADVLDVDIEVAASGDANREIWARAFTLNEEILGMSYDWGSSARVSLDRRNGPNVIATISFPTEAEEEDDRPARVTAEIFGIDTELDLLSITSTDQFVFQRQTPPEAIVPEAAGCSEPCDPYAFAGLFLFLGFRPLTRRKPRRV